MASYVYSHTAYCHNGPRQGVYPLQQLQHYRMVRWRATQLRHPDTSYRHKLRTEPAVTLPSPPALPSRNIKRSSSCISMSTQNTQTKMVSSKNSTQSSQFLIATASMAIRSRPPLKEKTPPPLAKCPPPSEDYPYLDPLEVNGDSSFEERLAEMAQHEVNTIKQEEWNKSKRISSRPSSARCIIKSASSQSMSASVSRPTSARNIPPTTSVKQRKTSTTSVTGSSRRCSSRVKPSVIHTSSGDIHRSKSAVELKQSETHTKSAPLEASPPKSESKNCTEIPPPQQARAEKNTDKDVVTREEKKPSKTILKTRSRKVSSDSEDSKADDLNETSDLGLSVDSLHLSGEDTDLSLEPQKDSTSTVVLPAESDRGESSLPPSICFEVLVTPPKNSKKHRSRKQN